MWVNIIPKGAPRLNHNSRFSKKATAYYAYKDAIRLQYKGTLPSTIFLVFNMPMPAHWSSKKRLLSEGTPCMKRPDLDNMIKAVLDALCKEDGYIHSIYAKKVYSLTPGIEITEL